MNLFFSGKLSMKNKPLLFIWTLFIIYKNIIFDFYMQFTTDYNFFLSYKKKSRQKSRKKIFKKKVKKNLQNLKDKFRWILFLKDKMIII